MIINHSLNPAHKSRTWLVVAGCARRNVGCQVDGRPLCFPWIIVNLRDQYAFHSFSTCTCGWWTSPTWIMNSVVKNANRFKLQPSNIRVDANKPSDLDNLLVITRIRIWVLRLWWGILQTKQTSSNPTTRLLLDSQKPTEFTSFILKDINYCSLRILFVTQIPRSGSPVPDAVCDVLPKQRADVSVRISFLDFAYVRTMLSM